MKVIGDNIVAFGSKKLVKGDNLFVVSRYTINIDSNGDVKIRT
jgi:hypothetical protein